MNTAGANARARSAALAAAAATERHPVSVVTYRSAGRVLVIGDDSAVLEVAARIAVHEHLSCTVVVNTLASDGRPANLWDHGTGVIQAPVAGLTGHLGNFQVMVESPGAARSLHEFTGHAPASVDLVLDLGESPLLVSEVLPPGYYAPGRDAGRLQAVLEELPDMVGEFEKPRFFQYNPSICAHGRSGITACTRCLDSCPTGAIVPDGEGIRVDPNLCQGAGSCATACPTGAITYNYPRAGDTLRQLRLALKTYYGAGGRRAVLLFHDSGRGREALGRWSQELPHEVLALEVEEAGSVGMDTWLAAFAYGASAVVVLVSPQTPARVAAEIRTQLEYARTILDGLGYPAGALQIAGDQQDDLMDILRDLPEADCFCPGDFAPLDDKRTVIRLAVDHLFDQAPSTRLMTPLPAGAPFGEIQVDPERCTLCMACVSQCPAHALLAGDDTPQLRFIEDNCVQCGLCCRSCPENAIVASPRYLYERDKRLGIRVLYEEQPFCCIHCGKAFANSTMIAHMTAKLRGHPMFHGKALDRLKMCEDCRVKDMAAGQEGGAMPGGFS